MNVTKDGFENRQLHIEDYLQMVSAEQREYAERYNIIYKTNVDKYHYKIYYTYKVSYSTNQPNNKSTEGR
jgi:hypothetical protein